MLALIPLRSRVNRYYQNALFYLYIVVNSTMITLLNLADAVYFNGTLKRINNDELHFAENDNTLSVAWLFLCDNILLLATLTIMTFGIKWAYMRDALVTPNRADSKLIFYLKNSAVLLLAMAFIVVGVRGGISKDRPITLTNAMQYTTDNNIANAILSNPFCLVRSIGNRRIVVPKYFDAERLESIFTPYHYPAQNKSTAKLEGYNVVIFILESFSAENSAFLSPDLYSADDLTDGKGNMPLLDSLMREGLSLRNLYATERRSICAMPAIFGGIPSLDKPFALMPESIGKTEQMPAILAKMGYTTTFFCGSPNTSMGFAGYAKSAGIEHCFTMEDYEKVYGGNDYDNAWGIFDLPFLSYTQEQISKLQEPFFATVFTISSHHPYTIPESHKEVVPEGYTKIQPVIAYTDMALHNFFEQAKNEPWFNRTIFVFIADHVAIDKMADRTMKYPGSHHIAGAIYTPDGALKSNEIAEIVQQTDIMPTLLNLLGNREPFFSFGRDIFDTDSTRPKWAVSHNGVTSAVTMKNGNIEVVKVADEGEAGEQLRAFEQQYYDHISRRAYIAPQK